MDKETKMLSISLSLFIKFCYHVWPKIIKRDNQGEIFL